MKTSPSPAYEFADFRINAATRLLARRDGSPVPLTPRVFDTLLYMVEHSGEVLERDRLMEAVWPDAIVEENNLTQNISTLRRVLGDERGSNRFIATVPGRGYRFVAEVRAAEEEATRANGSASIGVPPRAISESVTPPQTIVGEPKPNSRFILITAVALLAVGSGVFVFWRNHSQPFPAAEASRVAVSISAKSIAVLPFDNLSGDPANAYFAEGVKDEILTRLSKITALKVISRTSTQKFRSAPDNVREIAQRLGVANILEGSVQRSGDAVRVTVQLIAAESDTHLWADTYDRKLTDMFEVETEIAQRVAASLEATLTGAETRAVHAQPTQNVEAHHAYLKGRYFWNKRTNEGYRQAIDHFNRAIELDPTYAVAYAGLADAMTFLGGDSPATQHETLAKARAALQHAIALDETLAEAHASLGLLAMNFDWDWAAAERRFQRALELNPSYATAHQWYGEFLAGMARFDEGIAELKRARELDPLSLIINTDLGKVYLLARRNDEAIQQYRTALEMDPDFEVARGLLAITYSFKGMHEQAGVEIRKLKDLENEPMHVSWIGCIEALAGNNVQAASALQRLQDLSTRTYVAPTWMMFLCAAMGEREQFFAWADRVLAERAVAGAIPLKVNPLFDSVRSDPRYAALLRRVNFEP